MCQMPPAPPSHAAIQLLTAQKDTTGSSGATGTEGREARSPANLWSWEFCILCCFHFWSSKQSLRGSEREGLGEAAPSFVWFCSVSSFVSFIFSTHHKFFSSPLIVWAKCWKLRPIFHPPSTSSNTSWPGSHQEYWPIRIRRIFLC